MTKHLKPLKNDAAELLTQSDVDNLNAYCAANASRWLSENLPTTKAKVAKPPKSACGRKPKTIKNPFYGYIGCVTLWGRYPAFAMDVIEGVARLDWHDRPAGSAGKLMPLSVAKLTLILETLQFVTNDSVEDLLQLKERHARRYVKAIELIMPRMIASRPKSLFNEMEGIETEPRPSDWEDETNCNPSPEELEKLHHDLRTLTQYKTAEEYETELDEYLPTSNIIAITDRLPHPKKAQVMQMLSDFTIAAIERETGVSAKTIRKWRDELHHESERMHAA